MLYRHYSVQAYFCQAFKLLVNKYGYFVDILVYLKTVYTQLKRFLFLQNCDILKNIKKLAVKTV